MIGFTFKYFFKEMKKNISMIGAITSALLLLSLILSMFYNKTLNPPLSTDNITEFYIGLFRATVLLVFMLICIYLIVYSANYYNKVHSRILGLLKIFGHTNQEIVVFFVIQLVIIFSCFTYIIYFITHCSNTFII